MFTQADSNTFALFLECASDNVLPAGNTHGRTVAHRRSGACEGIFVIV